MSEYVIAWLVMMFPIVFSPGPANVVIASSGARFGLKGTLKLMIGVNTTIMLMALAVGFGMNEFIKLYPKALSTLRYIGAAYLVYLA